MSFRLKLSFIAVSLLLSCGLYACRDPEPVRIGFLGGLTGRAAGLGVSGRNGFLLAIEQANLKGGIRGRKIEALISDDQMDVKVATSVLGGMFNSQVVAVVGPMTSQVAVAVVPEANRAQVPMISPTVSTNQLTGLDDYFLRVYYSNSQAAGLLAGHLADHRQRPRIAAIYDQSNSAYTEDWINAFRQRYEQLGGTLLAAIPFDSRQGVPFGLLANQAFKEQPRGVLLLANALDTAMIAQQFAKQGANLPLYATGWSYSDDLLQFGGASVEGLTIVQSADLNSQHPEYQAFRREYVERFRDEPNFPALHAYDATHTVIAALKAVDDRGTKLKAVLLARPATRGAQGVVAFDRFGDLRAPELHLATIEKGRFRSLR